MRVKCTINADCGIKKGRTFKCSTFFTELYFDYSETTSKVISALTSRCNFTIAL